MLSNSNIEKIKEIWDEYIKSDKLVLDTKGKELPDIDKSRLEAIEKLKTIINKFIQNEIDIHEFKTSIDSFNKRNNLWGFTAIKGQMFFNQLLKYNDDKLDLITELLKKTIAEPNDIKEALEKIDQLERFCFEYFNIADDKRKVANPKSVGYFISYFWQIYDPEKWPIIYTSLVKSFEELELWENKPTQKESYKYFYYLNSEIKSILKDHTNRKITNWDLEHAFWNKIGNPLKVVEKEDINNITQEESVVSINPSFDLSDYVLPKISKLEEIGASVQDSSSAKGHKFETLVAEIFELLDFDVTYLGQGKGRNPDAIIKYSRENIAFIVDAKAYKDGYNINTFDERAIREYINYYCPKLQNEGFKKIGFIIVSNSFKSDFQDFVNEITWSTDIKRFILLSSKALLYLFAYKMKDKRELITIIESMIKFDNPVEAKDVVEEFDDL